MHAGAQFIFKIYDLEVKDRMDMFYLGDALRSLDFIPTLTLVEKLGGTKDKGQKYITIEEFLPIVHQVANTKDMGNYEVFVECFRLYDRHENGLMMASDLQKILTEFGEKMLPEQVELLFEECADAEDEDGCIPYEKFLEKVCRGPYQEFFQSL